MRVVARGDEVLIAVEQAQAVDRGGIAIAVVVTELEFLVAAPAPAQPHQFDAQRGVRRPQARVGLDRLAVVGDRILIAVVQLELMRNARVAFAVIRIDRAHLRRATHRASGRRSVRSRHEWPSRRAHRSRARWPCRLRLRPCRGHRSSARSASSSWASASLGSSCNGLQCVFAGLAVEAFG